MGKTQPCPNDTVQLSEGAKFHFTRHQVVQSRNDVGREIASLLEKQLSHNSDILEHTLKHTLTTIYKYLLFLRFPRYTAMNSFKWPYANK